MRNARKSQCIGNFVGIECSNVVLFGDNTNGVGITKVVDAYRLPRCPFFVRFHQSQCEGLTQALILS